MCILILDIISSELHVAMLGRLAAAVPTVTQRCIDCIGNKDVYTYRRSLVLPARHVLLADGQVGIAKAGHGPGVTVHPPGGSLAALLT